MNYVDYISYICLGAISIFTHKTYSLGLLQPLRREIRFSKFDFHFSKESTGTVLKCSIQNFPDKQRMFMHLIFHEKITNLNMECSVSKCKDYYVDCVNVMTYEVKDFCSTFYLITAFINYENTKQQMINKCPVFGEYYYNNLTFISDKFGSVYGLSTERWWELYWKIHVKFYDTNRTSIANFNSEFYFLQLRNRNRKH